MYYDTWMKPTWESICIWRRDVRSHAMARYNTRALTVFARGLVSLFGQCLPFFSFCTIIRPTAQNMRWSDNIQACYYIDQRCAQSRMFWLQIDAGIDTFSKMTTLSCGD